MSGAPSSFSTWLYNNAPSFLGGGSGLQEGPTAGGTTLDQSMAGQTQAVGSSPAWVQALQDAAKSSVANPKTPPALGAAAIPTGRPGAPARPQSLDALVQLLEKQRAAYGTLSGQPVAQPRQLGLLGF